MKQAEPAWYFLEYIINIGSRSADINIGSTGAYININIRDAAQWTLEFIRHRATTLYGSTTLDGSIHYMSWALNNEVAYMTFRFLCLEFGIRLTGLRSAMHLNGREGVVRGQDPKSISIERWSIRMDDGTCGSARAVNFEHIRRGDYKRRSPQDALHSCSCCCVASGFMALGFFVLFCFHCIVHVHVVECERKGSCNW